MSKPPMLDLPEGARAYPLETARGVFAAHEAGEAHRGTALLLPGLTGSKEDFIALLGPLARAGYRVVAVDGRGQHQTAGPPGEAAYAQAELARDVLAQAAAIGGTPHLVGHSLGGLVARAAVCADATPFRSLTLMSSGPGRVSPGQGERLEALLAALPVMGMAELWKAVREMDPPEAPDARTPDEVLAFLRGRWMANSPDQLAAASRQLLTEPDRVDELARVPLPFHVLSGVRDYVWPVTQMDDMAVRLGARRTVIAGSEHSPNAERPEQTARALGAFWADVDEGRVPDGGTPRATGAPESGR